MTENQMPQQRLHASALVETPQAARYLTQLCKHFQHKLPVTQEGSSGRISFGMGDCRLQAEGATLRLAVEAPDDAGLSRLQEVVARHLVRFAFREELNINWQTA